MPSGKQILLAEFQHLSQTKLTEEQIHEATERLRACLLLHGSTPDYAWPVVERCGWLSREHGGLQGPGLVEENIFLADLIQELFASQSIPETVKEKYPELSLNSYRIGLHVIWLLVSQLYYQDYYSGVENGGVLEKYEAERLISSYIKKLQAYRLDPESFIGVPVEDAENGFLSHLSIDINSHPGSQKDDLSES